MHSKFTQPIKTLMYIPHKKKFDIVKTVFINNKIHYCVDDLAPSFYIPLSKYIWNSANNEFDQYQPHLDWMKELSHH